MKLFQSLKIVGVGKQVGVCDPFLKPLPVFGWIDLVLLWGSGGRGVGGECQEAFLIIFAAGSVARFLLPLPVFQIQISFHHREISLAFYHIVLK